MKTATEINAERIEEIIVDFVVRHHRWSPRLLARVIVEAFPELSGSPVNLPLDQQIAAAMDAAEAYNKLLREETRVRNADQPCTI